MSQPKDTELRKAYVEKYVKNSYAKMNNAGVPITEPRERDTLKFAHESFDNLIIAHDKQLLQRVREGLPEKRNKSNTLNRFKNIANRSHDKVVDQISQALKNIEENL